MNCFILENDIVVCNATSVKKIQQYANLLTLLLKEASFLTEAYILDYFVESLWSKVPTSWLEVIKDLSISDLAIFLNSDEPVRCKNPLPLSLLTLRASAFALALPRKSIKSPRVIENFLFENYIIQNQKFCQDVLSGEENWSCVEDEFNEKSGQHKRIPEFCRRHVKPKKQHEIYRLAKVTDLLLSSFGIKHIIDVGSGLGHLSRFLTLSYNFNVATIEANQCNVSGAATFDKQAFCSLKKLKKHAVYEKPETLPHHTEESISLTSSEKCLRKVANQAWCQEECNESVKFGMLGLHTCGNLAETILKTFVKCDEAQALISVGCCYMKLVSSEDGGSYPLSNFVKSLPNRRLSYEAKEMACHALEAYIKRLQDNAPSLKIHCYRATLEKCITKHYPEMKHLGLRGVKHAELLKFSEYAVQALSRVSIRIPSETLSSPEVDMCLSRWKEVLVFYSLRLIMAPVVESLILLDRMLYLFEQGYPSCLAPVFDPSISPRNHVLLSSKCDNKDLF